MLAQARSNVIRHIIPGSMFFIYLFLAAPSFLKEKSISILGIFSMAFGALILGFVLDTIIIPFLLEIFRKIRKVRSERESMLAIEYIIFYEINKISFEKVKNRMIEIFHPNTIFDAYMNEAEEDKVIDRLFFLFDMVHFMRVLFAVTVIGIFLPIIPALKPDINIDTLWLYYILIFSMLISFCCLYRNKSTQAARYEYNLVVKNIYNIWEYIKKIKVEELIKMSLYIDVPQNTWIEVKSAYKNNEYSRAFDILLKGYIAREGG